MAIWRRQFFHQEMGDTGERSSFLACDTANGHVYVITGRALPDQEYHEIETDISDFLTSDISPAKHALLQLIGTLVHGERSA